MQNFLENFQLFNRELRLGQGEKIDLDNHLSPIFNSIFPGDTLRLSISIDSAESFTYSPTNGNEDLVKILTLNEHIDDESETTIKYEIIKKDSAILGIYHIESFNLFISSLTLQQLLTVLSSKFSKFQHVLIKSNENDSCTFQTNLFSTETFLGDSLTQSNKLKRIEAWKFSSNTQNIGSYNFIPEDFHVIEQSTEFDVLAKIFNKIANILSISYISDMSSIRGNLFEFRIVGYKNINYSISFNNPQNEIPSTFYKIYHWIYDSGNGNIDDKLGLARNIISRRLDDNSESSFYLLNDEVYSSILTAHKIFLKENVERYIETKNKVAELITDMSIKNRDLVLFISSSFKNNNLTLLSYFISLLIFNSLSDDNQKRVFTEEKYFISLAFLLISSIYLITTGKQVNKDLKRNSRHFFTIKRIYKDLFDKNDLDKLFNKRHLRYDLNNVKSTIQSYMLFWLFEIIILLILTICLTFSNEIKIFNYFGNLIIKLF